MEEANGPTQNLIMELINFFCLYACYFRISYIQVKESALACYFHHFEYYIQMILTRPLSHVM
jgi:hypothetical protein